MTTPKRIQRKRTKGWKMPAGAAYVGRPSKWGNPFRAGPRIDDGHGDGHVMAALAFRSWLRGDGHWPQHPQERAFIRANIEQLRGKDLACWCPLDRPCHADVLLEMANRTEDRSR